MFWGVLTSTAERHVHGCLTYLRRISSLQTFAWQLAIAFRCRQPVLRPRLPWRRATDRAASTQMRHSPGGRGLRSGCQPPAPPEGPEGDATPGCGRLRPPHGALPPCRVCPQMSPTRLRRTRGHRSHRMRAHPDNLALTGWPLWRPRLQQAHILRPQGVRSSAYKFGGKHRFIHHSD